jgi:hypothetical protein
MKGQKRTGGKRRKSKPRKPRTLLPRQVKLIDGITAGKSVRRAALDAGYSERMAGHPQELLGSKQLREHFARLMPPVEKIAQRIHEGLDAERLEFAKEHGKIRDIVRCVDFEQRRKYAELAATFLGLAPEVGINVKLEGSVHELSDPELRLRLILSVYQLTGGFDPSEIGRLKATAEAAADLQREGLAMAEIAARLCSALPAPGTN